MRRERQREIRRERHSGLALDLRGVQDVGAAAEGRRGGAAAAVARRGGEATATESRTAWAKGDMARG